MDTMTWATASFLGLNQISFLENAWLTQKNIEHL